MLDDSRDNLAASASNSADWPVQRGLGFRWWICALLFFATTLSYVDRGVISYLKEELQTAFGWDEVDYSNVVAAFSLSYAFGYLFAGRLIDLIGIRLGFALSVGLWSLAAASHALVGFVPAAARFSATIPLSVAGFMAARFTLGLAEGGNFPAAVKTVSEWFPVRERALATGIFNSGSNIGAILTPLLIPTILAIGLGWPACFIITGSLGLFWLLAWLLVYRPPDRHPRVSPQELALIHSDPADPPARIPWLTLLRYRPTWAFIVGMALSGPVWWFYLYWLPDFLHKRFDLDTAHHMPWPIIVVYLVADFGSVAGGWLSSMLIVRGYTVNAGRKIALLVCALCVTPVFLAPRATDMWTASLLIALAAAAHQGFACNLYTIVSDTMPRRSVSSIIGIGGFAAGLAGMGFQKFSGYILKYYPEVSYTILFGIAAGAYLVALLVIQLLVPRIERVEMKEIAK